MEIRYIKRTDKQIENVFPLLNRLRAYKTHRASNMLKFGYT